MKGTPGRRIAVTSSFYEVSMEQLENRLLVSGDTHSETGRPARLPAKVAGRRDTHIDKVFGEEINIL